ncbi:MAG: helix-turn-helix transcriptional regulator [Clostridiales bacterium]|nr:helix-turn-helix transcriptional regulator [Clostridiales bacterium]
MYIEKLLAKQNMTKYRLSVISGIPHATLNDICSGKTRIDKCSAMTVYKLAKALNITMENLIELCLKETAVNNEREKSYEYGLPEYLQHDLDEYKKGLKKGSPLMDCLWGELYGSINVAEHTDGIISSQQAQYLRKKYLWR